MKHPNNNIIICGLLLILLFLSVGFAYGFDWDNCPCSSHAIVECGKKGDLRQSCNDKITKRCEDARETAKEMYTKFCENGDRDSKACKKAEWLMGDIARQTDCL